MNIEIFIILITLFLLVGGKASLFPHNYKGITASSSCHVFDISHYHFDNKFYLYPGLHKPCLNKTLCISACYIFLPSLAWTLLIVLALAREGNLLGLK